MLLFKGPENQISGRRKPKSQLKAHVTPISRIPDPLANRTDEPHLRHAQDGAHDSKAECEHSRDAGWEQIRVVPDGDVVLAPFEDKVLGEGDAFVDG